MGEVERSCMFHSRTEVTFGDGDKPLCDGCGGRDGVGDRCTRCNLQAHEECMKGILKFAGHKRHLLRLVSPGTLDYTDGKCHFCKKIPSEEFYHCSTCNFSVDVKCVWEGIHLRISNGRIHEHEFTLLPRTINFTCNACGLLGERNPYVCIECDFMIHKDCIDLPRVININRHDHRVSLTYHLGHEKTNPCGVCQDGIDWTFGGYLCKRCPDYAVHSKCATDKRVWDGIELEDVPEEEEEILEPYKMVNGEKEIIHFSHDHEEHHLTLVEDHHHVGDFEKMRCNGCMLPLNDRQYYKCKLCDFFLHRVCANLPRRKRHVLHNHKLDLYPPHNYSSKIDMFQCSACKRLSSGFRYKCRQGNHYLTPGSDEISLDALCGSISEPFRHDLHPHPLYFTLEDQSKTCESCGLPSPDVLTCKKCNFSLDFKCATLPTKVKHRCDDHYLSLRRGDKNVTGDLWCDICETRTDPNLWFYTCEDDCGVALHIKCVLGDMYLSKQAGSRTDPGPEEVIPNDSMTRPFCSICKVRCIFPSFIMMHVPPFGAVCSFECVFSIIPKG